MALVGVLAGCKGKAEWFGGTLDEAKDRARELDTVIVLDVTAKWCPACHELERNFWNSRRGLKTSQKYVVMQVDYDTESGQELVKRYNVLHLPTNLVIKPEGMELGRIVGFEDAGAFADELEKITSRIEPNLETLEKRHAKSPDDLQTMLELGEAYLEAGLQRKGISMLNKVRDKDADNSAGVYLDATRVLGRYFVRCGVDFYQGEQVFRQAVEKFPESEECWGFRYWIAVSMWDGGIEDEAKAYLQELITTYPDDARAHETRARFYQVEGLELDTALADIRKARKLDPENDWYPYVEAEILHA
jgi:tetratricopeptide (TPR) repeat protein